MIVFVSTISLKQGQTPGFCNVVNPDRKHHDPEYLRKILATNYTNYLHIIEKLHHISHWTYQFNEDEVKVLIGAGRVRSLTLRPSKIHVEELEEIEERLQTFLDQIELKSKLESKIESKLKLFFRMDACSTKDSSYGLGPNENASDIIKRITTSMKAIYSLEQRESDTIVLKLWDNHMTIGSEFRCFIYQGHLTAISQASCFEYFEWDKRTEELIELVHMVNDLYQQTENIFPSCIMDVIYHPEKQSCEILEFNPFGWDLNTGPACFHWQRDDHLLIHDDPEKVEVRVVRENHSTPSRNYYHTFRPKNLDSEMIQLKD